MLSPRDTNRLEAFVYIAKTFVHKSVGSPQQPLLNTCDLNTVKCNIPQVDGSEIDSNCSAMNELFHKHFPSLGLRFLTYTYT